MIEFIVIVVLIDLVEVAFSELDYLYREMMCIVC